MAWDGSGTYTRTNGTNTGATTWADDAAAATKILSTRHDTHDEDIATAINATLTQNNESKPTADFLPNTDDSYDLGSATKQWAEGFFSKSVHWAKGADVASATALPLIADGNIVDVTGTTTITSFNSVGIGTVMVLHFDGALILTHHATDLILPGAANITTVAGDEATFYEYASGDWRCLNYQSVNAVVANHIKAGNIQIPDGSVPTGNELDVEGLITESAFESVGPTGSGATNVWTDMDVIPANATILIVSVLLSFAPSGAGSASVNVYATHGDDASAAAGNSNRIASQTFDVDAAITGNSQFFIPQAYIPLGVTNRDFLLTWAASLETGIGISIQYKGFMTD